VPTVSVPEKADPTAGLNRIVNEADCPAAIVTAFPDVVVNPAPVTSKGETVRACGNGFSIENVHASCVPCTIRPKLIVRLASGPVHGAATLKIGAGTTVARRIALSMVPPQASVAPDIVAEPGVGPVPREAYRPQSPPPPPPDPRPMRLRDRILRRVFPAGM
jgi:hypothetical protein